jgi:hypothetical protein
VNLDNVTRDEMIVGGLAILLAISLLLFPWFDFSVTVGAFTASATATATGAPDGWLGILALLAALAVVADLAIEKFSPQTHVPLIGDSRANTRFILAAISAGFVALKFLFHIHFSLFGWGFYVTVIVTGALVYFAAQQRLAAPTGSSMNAPPPVGTTGPGGPSQPGRSGGGSTPPPGA